MTGEQITTVIGILGLVVGWFIPAPKQVAFNKIKDAIIANATPENINKIVTVINDPDQLNAVATAEVMAVAKNNGVTVDGKEITIDTDKAAKVAKWIGKRFKIRW